MSDEFDKSARGFNNPPSDAPDQGDETMKNIEHFGHSGPPPKMDGSHIHVLSIIGQIEGHVLLPPKNKTTKYEHVIPQLVAVEQNPDIKGLLLILNTVGGDIEAGLAIAEMVRTLSKPTVSLVLGGGHSIGTPIAVAASRSFISETATMTIHPIRLSGMVIGVPQTYEYLDKMQDRVIRFIVANSNVSPEGIREMMFRTGELVRDVGTVLVGREAVQAGLVDELGGISDALGYLQRLIDSGAGNHPQRNVSNYGFATNPPPGMPAFRQPMPQAPGPGAPGTGWPGPGGPFTPPPGGIH